MLIFVLKRVAWAILTLLVATWIAFVLVHLSGSTPGGVALGQSATPEQVVAYNESIGWYDPWIAAVPRLGRPGAAGQPRRLADRRTPDRARHRQATARDGGARRCSEPCSAPSSASSLGVIAAVRGGAVDRFITALSGILLSLPAFWVGVLLVYVFAVQLRLLPGDRVRAVRGRSPRRGSSRSCCPCSRSRSPRLAGIARQTRASMSEALTQEHMRTLRAVGTPTTAHRLRPRAARREPSDPRERRHPVHRPVRRLGRHRGALRPARHRPGDAVGRRLGRPALRPGARPGRDARRRRRQPRCSNCSTAPSTRNCVHHDRLHHLDPAISPRRATRRRPALPLARRPCISLVWLVGLLVASLTSPLWLRYGPLEQDLTAVLQGPSARAPARNRRARPRPALAHRHRGRSDAPHRLIPPIVAVAVTVPVTLWAVAQPARRGRHEPHQRDRAVAARARSSSSPSSPRSARTCRSSWRCSALLLFGALYRVFFGQAKSLQKQLFVEAAAVDGVRPIDREHPSRPAEHVDDRHRAVRAAFRRRHRMQAGLAFIGLGPQPPEPTWGGMIQTASRFIFQQPWMMVPTGAVLALTIIAANSLADVLAGGTAMPPPLVALRRKKSKTPVTEIAAAAVADDLPAGVSVDNEVAEGFPMIGDASIPVEQHRCDPQRVTGARCDLDRGTRIGRRVRRAPSSPAENDAAVAAATHGAEGELIVEDLVIGVDGGPALVTGVSLRVRPGSVMGLVGESGCGKSVTSYALLGLLSPGSLGALRARSGGTAPTSRTPTRRRCSRCAATRSRSSRRSPAARSTRCSPSAGSSPRRSSDCAA